MYYDIVDWSSENDSTLTGDKIIETKLIDEYLELLKILGDNRKKTTINSLTKTQLVDGIAKAKIIINKEATNSISVEEGRVESNILNTSDSVDGIASTQKEEPGFEFEERHVNLIDKFVEKSEKFLGELDDEKNTKIDIESDTLNLILDAPILKK